MSIGLSTEQVIESYRNYFEWLKSDNINCIFDLYKGQTILEQIKCIKMFEV